jgi:hypothetical protein
VVVEVVEFHLVVLEVLVVVEMVEHQVLHILVLMELLTQVVVVETGMMWHLKMVVVE